MGRCPQRGALAPGARGGQRSSWRRLAALYRVRVCLAQTMGIGGRGGALCADALDEEARKCYLGGARTPGSVRRAGAVGTVAGGGVVGRYPAETPRVGGCGALVSVQLRGAVGVSFGTGLGAVSLSAVTGCCGSAVWNGDRGCCAVGDVQTMLSTRASLRTYGNSMCPVAPRCPRTPSAPATTT